MDWWRLEYVWPVLGAVVAGGLIGFEREYRGRPAGLRTHILVCLAASLLMVAATHQAHWMVGVPTEVIRIDPVRMAHGVLTGVGFLCGGVIFRQGLSVHGLTTAASLWITSALGVLYGVSAYELAIGGTVATLGVLAGLRLLDQKLPRRRHIDVAVRFARADAMSLGEFETLVGALRLETSIVAHRLLDRGGMLELSATLVGGSSRQSTVLADRLAADPRVLEFEVSPRED